MALAWLQQAGIAWEPDLPPMHFASPDAISVVARMLDPANHRLLNTPLTSSMGRLFDAAAALAGVRQVATYEAQAAMEFEALCDPDETGSYPFSFADGVIDPAPLIVALVTDLRAGISKPKIAARFHNGVARMVVDICREISHSAGLHDIVLSGGVWQNRALLTRTAPLLRSAGFDVYVHRQVPPNDGGVALGQVAVAAWLISPGWTRTKG
jgi:hydrogenase maturation protein HypF